MSSWNVSVRPEPTVREASQHPCIECVNCRRCTCRTPTASSECELCQRIRWARRKADEDIARYKDQVANGHAYAMTASRLNRWNCRSLPSVDSCLSILECHIRRARSQKVDNAARHIVWQGLPVLFAAQELRAKKTHKRGCGICSPAPLQRGRECPVRRRMGAQPREAHGRARQSPAPSRVSAAAADQAPRRIHQPGTCNWAVGDGHHPMSPLRPSPGMHLGQGIGLVDEEGLNRCGERPRDDTYRRPARSTPKAAYPWPGSRS